MKTDDKTVVLPQFPQIRFHKVVDRDATQRIPQLSPVVEGRVIKNKKKVDLETVLIFILIWAAIAATAFMVGLAYMVWSWIVP